MKKNMLQQHINYSHYHNAYSHQNNHKFYEVYILIFFALRIKFNLKLIYF